MPRITFLNAMKAVHRRTLPKSLCVKLTPFTESIHESFLAKERSQRKFFAISHDDINGEVCTTLRGENEIGGSSLGLGTTNVARCWRKTLWVSNSKNEKSVIWKTYHKKLINAEYQIIFLLNLTHILLYIRPYL